MLNSSYRLGRVLGIPIRVHVTLILLLPLLALMVQRGSGFMALLAGLVLIAAFFASIALHELGHSVVALRFGCRVRQILLLPIGGVAQLSHLPARPREELWIALAGPAVSLLLWFLLGAASSLLASAHASLSAGLLSDASRLNLALALFNLLPSFPMDGGRVFRAFLTPRLGRLAATYAACKIGRIMAWVFGIYGLFSGNFFLLFIAFFIHQAAGAEYRQVAMEEARREPGAAWFGEDLPTVDDSDEVLIGPPPYARGSEKRGRPVSRRPDHDLFNRLFDEWR